MKDKHRQLQDVAIGWLYGVGCTVFAQEVPTQNGIADALGVKRNDDVYYLECKASRSDLICLKQKSCYARSIGGKEKKCYIHTYKGLDGKVNMVGAEACQGCKIVATSRGDTGVDFYYIIAADGIRTDDVYPMWGVIDERGKIVRKAKRMKRNSRDSKALLHDIAHVLVYKVFGKMYLK